MKNYSLFVIILAFLFWGCPTNKNKNTEPVIPKVLGRLITDSMSSPVVTPMTAANAPRIIKAADPTIVALSYPGGVGVPSFTNYTVADGLPSIYVSSSVIDHDGNLWLATLSGISKYDGTSFTNYNTGNGLVSDFTKRLFVDSKNNIWIETADDALSIFDGRSFSIPVIDKNLSKDSILYVNNIMEDNKRIIWLSTSRGLYKYEHDVFTKFTAADGLTATAIRSVIQDKNGNLLVSTVKGINSFDGRSFSPYTNIPDKAGKIFNFPNTNIPAKNGQFPYLLYCDSKGDLWFSYISGGFGRYDGKQIKMFTQQDGYNGGTKLLEDKTGNFWIAGGDGLTKFDGNRFITFTTKDGLSSNDIRSLAADEQGNIWAATRNGISKITYSYLSNLEVAADNGVSTITIDKSGNKWITGEKGLGKYYSDHISFFGKELLSSNQNISLVFADHAGNIWFELSDLKNNSFELIKFDGNTFSIFGKEQGMHFGFNSIMEDDSNNIWIAGAGLAKFDGAAFTNYSTIQSLTGSAGFFSILPDSKKILWIGSTDSGVYKLDGHTLTVYNSRDGLPSNFINQIAEDPFGNTWFATDGGAARFDGKTFTSYRAAEGLDNAVTDILPDSVNRSFWFITNIGLACLKFEEIGKEKPFFERFDQRNGFKFGSPNSRSLYADNQGVVWGGDLNNIFRFDYRMIRDLKPISIRIKNIRLNDQNICWNSLYKANDPASAKDSLTAVNEIVLKFGKAFSAQDLRAMSDAFGKISFDSIASPDFIPVNLVLPFQNNNITFEFGSISPSFGKYTQFQYKLEGYDKNWSPLSDKTEASFGNMSEGHYTFHLKALSPLGNWSETSYSFKVLPPWWRTWWAYASYILLLALAIYTFIRWRTKVLQKEKMQLEEKVIHRTSELKESLEHLRATQSQLIHAEKMASLGELTAGIAHEIQNPLNFVNNFSEVSNELIDEMKVEIEKGDMEETKAIANDLKINLEKINHHGKRADAIVKGMLQHSRSSSAAKESTDINKLADEYLRLAYHGLRAKDKSFNATMKTEYDKSIGNINIVPQDIGRVFLNLITNAFYAVTEKKTQQPEGYEPTVTLSTKKINGRIVIKVEDNGNGIPPNVLNKIFQPFFTTKPTGQGTGLGLSLSYDIVKAHAGELNVETKEGEGSTFIVKLPAT